MAVAVAATADSYDNYMDENCNDLDIADNLDTGSWGRWADVVDSCMVGMAVVWL